MGRAIRKVLARRTNGANSWGSHSRNGDTSSNGGLCACCRDIFPVGGDGGDALVDCLAPRFRFSWPTCELGEERSLADWDDGDLGGLGAGSVSPSWHKCYGVCSASGGNSRAEVDAWKGGTGKNEIDVDVGAVDAGGVTGDG